MQRQAGTLGPAGPAGEWAQDSCNSWPLLSVCWAFKASAGQLRFVTVGLSCAPFGCHAPWSPSIAPQVVLRAPLLHVQGSLLSGLLASPLHLASITVSLQQPAEPAPPTAPAAAPALSQKQPQPTADSDAAGLAAAAAAALHRALIGRTAAVAQERLAGGSRPGEPALHIHEPQAATSPAPAPAVAAAPTASGAAAELARSPAGAAGSTQVASGSLLGMQELGLASSATRRVGSGASIVWFAPPSSAFKFRDARRQQAPPQQHAFTGNGTAAGAAAAALPAVLSGGTVEAVAGTTGLKVGAAKTRPGQPVHPSAQSAVCKAALFAAWRQLVATLQQLPAGPAAGAAPPADNAARPEGHGADPELTYRQAKVAAGAEYASAWRRLREPPSPFEDWIPKPLALEDFVPGC